MKFWTNNNGKITGTKDVDATLDFPIDFSAWLETDSYASHTITKTGDIVIVSHTQNNGIITPIISGGTLNELASFTIQITTVSGRVDERTFYLRILNR
jgi:hypothetical protein